MITKALCCAPGVFALFITGCANDTPLIFGSSNTVGISIGGSIAEPGGSFVIGYKSTDLALVPVTVVQPDGTEMQIGGAVRGDMFRDAFSVLGQFETTASKSTTGSKTGLGKFFATGLAAKKLSDGFAQKLGHGRTTVTACKDTEDPGEKPKPGATGGQPPQTPNQAAQTPNPTPQTPNPTPQTPQVAAATAPARPGQVMTFGQYLAFGFVVGGSAQGGVDLTLGLKDRNLAIVPVVTRNGTGAADPILSKNTTKDKTWPDPTDWDALSVLGQFSFDSTQDGAVIEAGLGKFFSTGIAASRLADGFKTKLCEEYQEPAKSGAAPAVKK